MPEQLCQRQHTVPQHPKRCFSKPRSRQPCCTRSATANSSLKADVVVVGAGIVGISICRQILRQSGGSCTVHLVDDKAPGHATGAGQGYIWMAHREIGTPAWFLAEWSCRKWQESLTPQLRAAVEWQDMGSILVANNSAEAEQLRERAEQLQEQGLKPEILGSRDLREAEPALRVSDTMTGLLLQSDAQINGRQSAAVLLQECQEFEAFTFHIPQKVKSLDLSSSGAVSGIVLKNKARILARKGVVITAGAWSGPFLAAVLEDESWERILKPRKGHLLELPWPESKPALRHGLMEVGYAKHYKLIGSAAGQPLGELQKAAEVTFTATMSAAGTCLLGSSREYTGYSSSPSEAVQHAIIERAREYLPAFDDMQAGMSDTRVGLRPYSSHGPIIGPIPEHQNLYIAGGHEGSGLTLAPATACLITSMILSESVPAFAESLRPEAVMARQLAAA